MTNTSGAIVAQYTYDAYGNITSMSGSQAADNPIRFSTKYFDANTGYYDFGFRSYDPTTGRWLNRDPIGEDGGLNLYGFVGNSPGNVWDDYGLDWREKVDDLLGSPAKVAGDAWGRYDSGCASGWEVAGKSLYGAAIVGSTATGIYGIGRAGIIKGGQLGVNAIKGSGQSTVTVSRWGRPGLKSGDWVMKGKANRWNYLKSGKYDLNPTNKYAPFSSGQEFTRPKSSLHKPKGPIGFLKGLLGQRIYKE